MNQCLFCESPLLRKIYKMGDYDIMQCSSCNSSTAFPLPSDEEISNYYDGFYNKHNTKKKQKIFKQKYFRKWFRSFNLPVNPSMLDIGGGGGFYSFAFEYSMKGVADYVDLDPQSCDFAKNFLKITNVYNSDVADLSDSKKYDFILSRHVIEHLKNPTELIDNALRLLNDNGVFLLIYPNADSIEYLGYPKRLRPRIDIIKSSNKLNIFKLIWLFISGKIAHGIDPIRHLHAISSRGVKEYLDKLSIYTYEARTAPLNHKIYSPYYKEDLLKKIKRIFVNRTLVKLRGGTHQIFIIKKNNQLF